MRIKLCESLLDGEIIIKIPVQMKFRTTSPAEDQIVVDLATQLLDTIQDELEYVLEDAVYPSLQDYTPKISENIQANLEIHHMYLYLDDYNEVLSSNGEITVDILLLDSANSSQVRNAFNTTLNNNVIWQEVTIPFEDEEFGQFDILVTLEKTGEVQVEEG